MNENSLKEIKTDTSKTLAQTSANIVAGITGLISSDRKDITLSIGHLWQKLVVNRQLSAFLEEWNEFVKKGLVSSNFENSKQKEYCLLELLNFLDEDFPDEERFQVLKKIYFVTSTEKWSSINDIQPQQFMKIARSLSSGEVILLFTCYKLSQSERKKHLSNEISSHASKWLKVLAEESTLKFQELIATYEYELIDKRLVTRRLNYDDSGISLGEYFRLTPLGFELCKFVTNYESLAKINKDK